MIEFGIDPGKSGGIAFRHGSGSVECIPMPATETDLTNQINNYLCRDLAEPEQVVAFVEEVGGYVGHAQPGSAMFKFGRNFGYILGTLAAYDIPTYLIKPQAWQKKLSLGTKSGRTPTEWKNHLKAEAQRRFPLLKVTLKTADALLLLAAGPKFL